MNFGAVGFIPTTPGTFPVREILPSLMSTSNEVVKRFFWTRHIRILARMIQASRVDLSCPERDREKGFDITRQSQGLASDIYSSLAKGSL